jgi:hypothetical protein
MRRNYGIEGCFYAALFEIGELVPKHVTKIHAQENFRTTKILKQTTLDI